MPHKSQAGEWDGGADSPVASSGVRQRRTTQLPYFVQTSGHCYSTPLQSVLRTTDAVYYDSYPAQYGLQTRSGNFLSSPHTCSTSLGSLHLQPERAIDRPIPPSSRSYEEATRSAGGPGGRQLKDLSFSSIPTSLSPDPKVG